LPLFLIIPNGDGYTVTVHGGDKANVE
jgi:hypothetical protein